MNDLFENSLEVEEIRVVCMDCNRLIRESLVQPPKAISHGICNKCEALRKAQEEQDE